MNPVEVLIFDMDGVLVDVRPSYRQAVRRTVSGYLELLLGEPMGSLDLVSTEDVVAMKHSRGFNSDWTLTTALVHYFLAQLPPLKPPNLPPRAAAGQVLAGLQGAGAHLAAPLGKLRQSADIPSFAKRVAAAGGGLEGVGKLLGGFANRGLVFAQGDLWHTNLVRRMFQEVYLGRDLFASIYGEESLWLSGEGLIEREELIPARRSLEALASQVPLAIATGRPRREAFYALEHFGIGDLFGAVVDLEDVEEAEAATGTASLGKPHPFPLLEAARRAEGAGKACAYVGDQPDDMRATRRAGERQPFLAIGCVAIASDPARAAESLRRAGADLVVRHPDGLLELDVWGGER